MLEVPKRSRAGNARTRSGFVHAASERRRHSTGNLMTISLNSNKEIQKLFSVQRHIFTARKQIAAKCADEKFQTNELGGAQPMTGALDSTRKPVYITSEKVRTRNQSVMLAIATTMPSAHKTTKQCTIEIEYILISMYMFDSHETLQYRSEWDEISRQY